MGGFTVAFLPMLIRTAQPPKIGAGFKDSHLDFVVAYEAPAITYRPSGSVTFTAGSCKLSNACSTISLAWLASIPQPSK